MLLKPGCLYSFGTYSLDLSSRSLTRAGEAVNLAPKTFDLLVLLVKSDGRLLSKRELMASLWPDMFVEEANLSFQVSTLRKALSEDGSEWIETVPKHGYRFRAEVTTPPQNQNAKPSEQVLPSPQLWSGRTKPWKKRWLWAAGMSVFLLIGLIIAPSRRGALPSSSEPEESSRAVPLTAYPGHEMQPSLSPDGSQVAFAWNGSSEDNFDIYVKLVGPGEPLRLTTNPAWDDSPAWSPDGQLIAFLRFHTPVTADVLVIPALGGAERKIGTINTRQEGSAMGTKRVLSPGNLAWTPDGKWIAFGGRPADDEAAGIWLLALNGTETRRLTQVSEHEFGDWAPAFSTATGSLAFIREHSLYASSVDVLALSSDLKPLGAPQTVTRERGAIQGLAWTPDGHNLVFSSGGHHAVSQIWKIAIPATSAGLPSQPQALPFGEHAAWISVSKNGRLVYAAQFRDSNIWRLATTAARHPASEPLLRSTFDEETPDYSPDGKRLVFTSTRSGAIEIWISNVDGSNPAQITSMRGPQCGNPSWSRDGRRILFNSRREGSADLYLLSPDSGEMRRITSDPGEEVEPRWSRDGRTIYFGSNRTGRFEVWKMPAGGGEPVRITGDGGLTASESFDGRFLYYAKHDGSPTSIWRVPVGGGQETMIVDGLSYALNFVVSERGIYFLAVGDTPDKTSIDFFDFEARKRSTLLKVGKQHWYGMALSPDHKSLLYSVIDNAGSNLMLVDKFR
jgi:Tol biopolymer transport system component/DNA-binding winged helix-turn-helix (wHTH) protein